jgi:hypothetical protein
VNLFHFQFFGLFYGYDKARHACCAWCHSLSLARYPYADGSSVIGTFHRYLIKLARQKHAAFSEVALLVNAKVRKPWEVSELCQRGLGHLFSSESTRIISRQRAELAMTM